MRITTRRTFLRGAGGAVLGLPWLEERGAGGPQGQATPAPAPGILLCADRGGSPRFLSRRAPRRTPRRFNGDLSAIIETKTAVGSHPIDLTPTLEPLDRLTGQGGTWSRVWTRTFQIGTDVHAQCASCFLSSAAPFTVTTSAWPLDRTLDHVVADRIGDRTPFRTLGIELQQPPGQSGVHLLRQHLLVRNGPCRTLDPQSP